MLLLVIGGIFAYKVHKNGGGLKGLLATAVGHDQETVKTLPKIYAVLLGQSQNLTDTIMVAEYDPQKQQASILSIPRDTFIGNNKNTATPWDKINAVYQTGPENVLKEINECVTAEGAVEIIDKSEYTDIYNILCDKCKQRAEQYLHDEVEVEFYMFRMDKSLLGKSQRADLLMEEFK